MAPSGLGGCAGPYRSHRHCGCCSAFCRASRRLRSSLRMGVGIQVENLNAWYGKTQALYDVRLVVAANHATALIGPSGCGKSTFIRCLNRLHETIPQGKVRGRVRLGTEDLYAMDPVDVRRVVGMVFQKPNPFPTMSIYENVAIGLKLGGIRNKSELLDRVEHSLRMAALWDEVKDRLHKPA